MTALISPLQKLRFVDSNGIALAGGKVFTYAAGTTTKQATYTDSSGLTPNPNPIILDSRGECACWLTPGQVYKFTLSPSTDTDPPTNPIWTVDNVSGIDDLSGVVLSANLSASSGSSLVGFIANGAGAVSRTVQAKLRDWVSVKDFNAKGDGVTDDTIAIQNALNAGAGGIVFFPIGTYIVNPQVFIPSNTWVLGSGPGSVIQCNSSTLARGVLTNAAGAGGNTNIKVSDLTVQRTVVNGGGFFDIIYFQNSTFIWIEDCKAIGAATGTTSPTGNKGICCDGCQYVWISRNYVKNVSDNPIATNWNGARTAGHIHISHNTTEIGSWTGSHILCTADHAVIEGNVAIGGTTFDIEVGDNVNDLVVRGNIAESCGLIIALSGTNLLIEGNTALSGSVNIATDFGTVTDIVIRNNNVAQIRVIATTNPFQSCTVEGNQVHGSAVYGIGVQEVDNATVKNNHVHNCTQYGIQLFTMKNYVIEGNTIHDNTLDGINAATARASTNCVFKNNTSYNNGGWGIAIDSPQVTDLIDNETWGNTSGNINVTNPTSGGNTPFRNVRFRGTGAPTFYGNPGSIYYRTDGGAGTCLYVKESAATSNGGWVGK